MLKNSSSGWPVSRVLSSEKIPVYTQPFAEAQSGLLPGPPAWAIISLCSLPGTDDEASSLSSLLGLAPDGGYLAARITANAGGLLHRLFTLTLTLPLSRKRRRVRGEGDLFLWPCSGRLPRPGVSPASCSLERGLSSILRRSVGPRSPGQPKDRSIILSICPGVNLDMALLSGFCCPTIVAVCRLRLADNSPR